MDPVHAERRASLGKLLGPRAALLLASPREQLRNGDVHYKFRQDSDILYLTGFEEPQTVAFFRPDHPETPFVMFVRPRSPADEIWTGRRSGVDGAKANFGADAAFPTGELDARLPELLAGVDDLHFAFGADEDWDLRVLRILAQVRAGERRGRRAPVRLVHARLTVHEMRLIKSELEIGHLRRAAQITAEAHSAAMRSARAGVGEHEIEALIDYTFRRRGGTGPGYPSIVGGGANAVILHYVENNAPLEDGKLVLIDAGCEVAGGFTADVTRTFPVGRPFSPAQRRVYQAVLDVQVAAIEAVRPGATIDAIHAQVVEQLTQKMVELGLLKGELPKLIEDQAYKSFYMHRTSHWLGLDVHDVGFYSVEGAARPLVPGMVLTIEPGIYIAEDAPVPAELRGIGVRIEDDILVTASGFDNLTRATPKSVADIEELVGA
jgi:Xaa-Pro aminopeptidase